MQFLFESVQQCQYLETKIAQSIDFERLLLALLCLTRSLAMFLNSKKCLRVNLCPHRSQRAVGRLIHRLGSLSLHASLRHRSSKPRIHRQYRLAGSLRVWREAHPYCGWMGTYLRISCRRKCQFQLNALWRDRVCLKCFNMIIKLNSATNKTSFYWFQCTSVENIITTKLRNSEKIKNFLNFSFLRCENERHFFVSRTTLNDHFSNKPPSTHQFWT